MADCAHAANERWCLRKCWVHRQRVLGGDKERKSGGEIAAVILQDTSSVAVGVTHTPGVVVMIVRRRMCIATVCAPCIHLIDLLRLVQELCLGGECLPVNPKLWG